MEREEARCKQSNTDELEPPEMAAETIMGSVSPKSTLAHTCKPESSSESQPVLLGAFWMKSTAQEMGFRKALGPHVDAPKDQPGHESGASGNSSSMWPNFPSQDKASSEEKCGALLDNGTVHSDTYSEKKSSKDSECVKTFQSTSAREAHQKRHS